NVQHEQPCFMLQTSQLSTVLRSSSDMQTSRLVAFAYHTSRSYCFIPDRSILTL
ncbi:hypothetical protein J6590_006136, partial [Homalodisca vitripennis]